MSSVGQAVGGIVGGTIGFFLGGPVGALRGAQIGIMAGGLIDPPKGPVINGPRLDDLSVQTSTYGAFIPRDYGTVAQQGNVFWLQGDALTEVQTTTTSGGKGGPQQTTNTWSYYATFAVGLCKGPIDGVRRIWIGGQLWYDAGSDDLSTIIASNAKADQFTLYLGTDTQTADPLIQADKGVANVPAYRGLAYIVFDTLPLEKYGNSLMGAQVKVEIVKNGTLGGLVFQGYESLPALGNFSNAPYRDSSGIYAWRIDSSWISSATTTVYRYLIPDIGDPVIVSSFGVVLPRAENNFGTTYIPQGRSDVPIFAVQDLTPGAGGLSLIHLDGSVITITAPTAGTASTGQTYVIKNGYVYFSCGDGASYSITRATVEGANPVSISLPWTVLDASLWMGTLGTDLFVVLRKASDSSLYMVGFDLETLENTFDFDFVTEFGTSDIALQCDSDGSKFYYVNSVGDFYVRETIQGDDILIGDISSTPTFIPPVQYFNWVVHYTSTDLFKIWMSGYGTEGRCGTWTGGLIVDSTESLGDIVQAECLTSSLLESADLDVTELTDTVRGYRVSQLGAIRGSIDPLRAAWPFDVVQHGYQIKFKRRGSASVATIPSTLLDARAAGEAPGVQITDAREMDLMLPRRVDVKYLDSVREYDVNEQPSPERTSTDAVGIRKVDLPIVFTGSEAAQKAETLLYLYWLERYDVILRLPPEYSELEPGDVITVTSDTANYELRLTSINTLPDGRLECAAKYNKAAIYTPVARGEEGRSTGATLTLDGPSVYSLLDIPLLRDDDDTAGFPVAMAGYLSGWPGGILYRSDDGGETWADLRAFTPGAVIGYATGTLAAHGGTVIDFASTLAVRLYAGTLASVTQAQMFAGQNWFAYGAHGRWEIIAAANAVLQGDGSYVLSDFLRGQRGTEWATGLHAANDRIVLLDATELAFISVNSSTIGAARDYRAITTGKALSSDSSLSFTYAGVNLECLSPVHLTGNRHPSTNDWTLTWTRRSRYDQWRDYVDAPLGESSESYEIDVYSDGTYATVVRTLTASSATVAYTSAQQVTDFGSNQATLYLKFYQLSATVGRGYALTQSITR